MQDGAVLSPSMERATRSPQSRHRKLRLMEATQHVSPASDRLLVENMAAQVAATQSSVDQTEAVNACIRVLRNVKNSVHLRALAARALGLLMLESRALADRLRLETEGLVDALLQIVGYCRRSRTQTADTRRVHVNCCLVISLLMQGTRRSSAQTSSRHHQQRRKVAWNDHEVSIAKDQEVVVPQSPVPGHPPGIGGAINRITGDSLAVDVAGRKTPSRMFKMDRHRVVTPVFPRQYIRDAPLNHLPLIQPTGGHHGSERDAMTVVATSPRGDLLLDHTTFNRDKAVHAAPSSPGSKMQTKLPTEEFKRQRLREILSSLWIRTSKMFANCEHSLNELIPRNKDFARGLRLHSCSSGMTVTLQRGAFRRRSGAIKAGNARPDLPFRIPSEVREHRRKLWRAADLVQSAYRYRRFRIALNRYRVAAIRIQALQRMRATCSWYHRVRLQIILVQARVRMRFCRDVFLVLRNAALLVQAVFRSVRMRRLRRLVLCAQRKENERVLSSIVLLQRVARGFLGRIATRELRLVRDQEWHAALIFQRCWYKRNNEWSTFLLLGCLREKENEEREFDSQVLAYKRNHMARVIRRTWLGYLAAKRNKAAEIIQRNIRRLAAQHFVESLRRQRMAHRRIKWFFRVHHAHRIRIARYLQFWWLKAVPGRLRHHLFVRRIMEELEDRRRKSEREENASSRIQALVRGHMGRKVALRERSARSIQRVTRVHLMRKHFKEEMTRIRALVSLQTADKCIDTALNKVVESTMKLYNASACAIQRIFRGCHCRMRVMRDIVYSELRTRMAVRIQRKWRHNAHQRAARKLLRAQKRKQTNPFQTETSVGVIIDRMLSLSAAFYDLDDELRGMHVQEWLRRLGLAAKYGELFQKNRWVASVDQIDVLMRLRELNLDACEEKLESIGVLDNEGMQMILTNLFAYQTIQETKRQRKELVLAREKQIRLKRNCGYAQKHLQACTDAQQKCEDALGEALQEAKEFRNPPKAVRDRQAACTRKLEDAVKKISQAHEKCESSAALHAAYAREIATRQQQFASQQESKEISAVHSLRSLRLIDQLNVAREIFLERFPGLDARAFAFVSALEENQVTRWQLQRFFDTYTTISEVKQNTKELTFFSFETEVKKHDHARFGQCADILQYGHERLTELFGISMEITILGVENVNRSGDSQHVMKERMVLERTLLVGAQKGAGSTGCLAAEEAKAHRIRLLYNVIRYPYVEEWDDEAQAYVYAIYSQIDDSTAPLDEDQQPFEQVPTRYYVTEKPIYTIEEEDKAIRIQAQTRRFLAQCHLQEMQRLNRRERRRAALEAEWDNSRQERAQFLTLKFQFQFRNNSHVSTWLGARVKSKPPVHSAPTAVSPTKRGNGTKKSTGAKSATKTAGRSQKEDSSKINEATGGQEQRRVRVHATLNAAVDALAPTYHASVRAEHRRNWSFSANSRPGNAYGRAIVRLLEELPTLYRQTAPDSLATCRLRYTKMALRFGWEEVLSNAALGVNMSNAPPSYFFNENTLETSWERPDYSFDEQIAAIRIQALARMLFAINAREKELTAISFVTTVQDTIKQAARVGWVGYSLEGMTSAVFLSRFGLTNHARAQEKTIFRELSAVLRMPRRLLSSPASSQSLVKDEEIMGTAAVPVVPISPEVEERWLQKALSRYPSRAVKGVWENEVESSFSYAQMALYLREEALERVLAWERTALLCQTAFRMLRVRRWYLATQEARARAATTIQCAWRSLGAREVRALLESQQQSPYEQRLDKRTSSFYFVYTPTDEKLLEEPRDEITGGILPFRPMIQDRLTKRWMLAWPHYTPPSRRARTSKPAPGAETPWVTCSLCSAERAARRCNECYSPTGDYVDFCLACFYDRHFPTAAANSSEDLSWHTYTALNPLSTPFFRCVECTRPSILRCLPCNEHYCGRCFTRVHARGKTRSRHARECVRWMGNPGCFERFHTKGKRSDHTFTMVEVPTEMPQEILALEEQTRQKKTKKKKRSPVDAPDGKKICAVPLCRHRALVLDVPGVSFCPEHFTLQHALEVAGKDPLEAARLLTLVDNGGGRVVKSQKTGWRGLLPGNLFPRGHRDTKKPPKMKETSTSVQADSSTTTTT
ncbi:WW domain [Phytophthora cactorum]|nr:WW domain [Phytophthora cactorum]